MKLIVLIFVVCSLSFAVKSQNDKEFAKNYLFWIWNRGDASDFRVSENPTEKALVEKKINVAIANVAKSGINLGTASVGNVYSIDVLGTNKRILLVVYQTDTTQWDDLVLCLENDKICDIGNVENCFLMNRELIGQHYFNKENLPLLFDKNAITTNLVLNEVKTLIRVSNNHQLESFCPKILYTGGDVGNRKNRKEACNIAFPKDKLYCNSLMDKLAGYISSPDDFTVSYIKTVNKEIKIEINCNQTKNIRQFYFTIVKGKLLLSSII